MTRTYSSRPSPRRFARLSILATVLPLLGGCAVQNADGEDTDSRDDALHTTYGVDYAWARP